MYAPLGAVTLACLAQAPYVSKLSPHPHTTSPVMACDRKRLTTPSPIGLDHTTYGSAVGSNASLATRSQRATNGTTDTDVMAPATVGSRDPVTGTATSPASVATQRTAGDRQRTTLTAVGVRSIVRQPKSTQPAGVS